MDLSPKVKALTEKLEALAQRYSEGAEADAAFDGGEWSGPANAKAHEEARERLLEESHLTPEEWAELARWEAGDYPEGWSVRGRCL